MCCFFELMGYLAGLPDTPYLSSKTECLSARERKCSLGTTTPQHPCISVSITSRSSTLLPCPACMHVQMQVSHLLLRPGSAMQQSPLGHAGFVPDIGALVHCHHTQGFSRICTPSPMHGLPCCRLALKVPNRAISIDLYTNV